jgi:hypothetical protein
MFEGIQYILDDEGRRKYVIIDLERWREYWKDFDDLIVSDSSDRAALFVGRLLDATEKLSNYPKSGRVIPSESIFIFVFNKWWNTYEIYIYPIIVETCKVTD